MSAPKTAKLLNSLLDSQKTDRARLKQLEGRLAEADARLAAAVAAAVLAAESQFKPQLERVQQERDVERACRSEVTASKDRQIAELTASKDWQITGLKQELSGVRQLLAAADVSNEELNSLVEALGDNRDKAAQAAADLADARAEVAKQREELQHLLDGVREHMRKKDYDRERAILNRGVLARGAPGINLK